MCLHVSCTPYLCVPCPLCTPPPTHTHHTLLDPPACLSRCPEVVAAALEGVWRKLVCGSSSSNSTDWAKAAEVMRRLLQQAGSDAQKLRLYRWVCLSLCL